jgi:hypothetical protein
MDIKPITPAVLRTIAAARPIYEQQIGPVLCTLLVSSKGDKMATFTTDSHSGFFVYGGIDLQFLFPDQIDETFDMVRNRTTQQIGGITVHTMDWPGGPAPVHIVAIPADGAFVLFPPGCFEGHADTHDAALA